MRPRRWSSTPRRLRQLVAYYLAIEDDSLREVDRASEPPPPDGEDDDIPF